MYIRWFFANQGPNRGSCSATSGETISPRTAGPQASMTNCFHATSAGGPVPAQGDASRRRRNPEQVQLASTKHLERHAVLTHHRILRVRNFDHGPPAYRQDADTPIGRAEHRPSTDCARRLVRKPRSEM